MRKRISFVQPAAKIDRPTPLATERSRRGEFWLEFTFADRALHDQSLLSAFFLAELLSFFVVFSLESFGFLSFSAPFL